MITIRTLNSEIKFDQNKEYAIHHVSYDSIDYGDIVVVTEKRRYSIKGVYKPYDWITKILDEVKSKSDEKNVYIDMNELHIDGTDSSFDNSRINNDFIVGFLN